MTKLTDLEICKKIAEIEGEGKTHFLDVASYEEDFYIDDNEDKWAYYKNPLTDDALCFKLMVKHQITMEHFNIINNKTTNYNAYQVDGELEYDCFNENPNRAICLAIIEAHSC